MAAKSFGMFVSKRIASLELLSGFFKLSRVSSKLSRAFFKLSIALSQRRRALSAGVAFVVSTRKDRLILQG